MLNLFIFKLSWHINKNVLGVFPPKKKKNRICVFVSILFDFLKSSTNMYETYKTNIALQHSLFLYEKNLKRLSEIV